MPQCENLPNFFNTAFQQKEKDKWKQAYPDTFAQTQPMDGSQWRHCTH